MNPSATTAPPGRHNVRSSVGPGSSWDICFGGRSVNIRNTKGINDLATLIGAPGVDVDVVELMDGGAGAKRSTGADALDQRAVAEYRHRLGEIEVALADADLGAHLQRTVTTGRYCRYR